MSKFVEEKEEGEETVSEARFSVVAYKLSFTYREACDSGEHTFQTRGRSAESLKWNLRWGKLGGSLALYTDVRPQVEQAEVGLRILGEDGSRVIEEVTYPMCTYTYNVRTTIDGLDVKLPVKSLTITMKIATTNAVLGPYQTIHNSYRRDLFESGKHSDMKMTVYGREFPVHGLVLSSASPVLEAMVHEMSEKRDGEIKVTDTTPEVMESVLRYIYTGEVSDLKKNAMDVVKVAEKYQLLELKDLCQDELVSSLVSDNAIELFCASLTYSLARLRFKSSQCIEENKKTILKGNPDWEKLKSKNPKMAFQLLEDIL